MRHTYTAPTPDEVEAARNAGTQTALITTPRGVITVELYGKEAPLTVANFVKLVQSGFYNGSSFNHIDRGIAIQGGDAGVGRQRRVYHQAGNRPAPLPCQRRTGHGPPSDPDSASCQFYITDGAQPQLDGLFAVFGKVVHGIELVKKMRKGDAIIRIAMKK